MDPVISVKVVVATLMWGVSATKVLLSVGSHIVSTAAGDPVSPKAFRMSMVSIVLDYVGYVMAWYVVDWDALMLPQYLIGALASTIHGTCFLVRIVHNNPRAKAKEVVE